MYLLLLTTVICTSSVVGDASCCLPKTFTTTQTSVDQHPDLVENITINYNKYKILKILPKFDLLFDPLAQRKYKFYKDGRCEKTKLKPFLFMQECIPTGSQLVSNPKKHDGKGVETWKYTLDIDVQLWTFDSKCNPLTVGEKKEGWKDFIYWEWTPFSTEIDSDLLERCY